MERHTSETSDENREEGANPDTGIIGYNQQLDDFKTFLTQWELYMAEMRGDDWQQPPIPTTNNRLPGPLVMLYGRGGLGKSTLLNHYRTFVLETNRLRSKIVVSSIIDSDTLINRPAYTYLNPTEGQLLDPISFYDALANAMAIAQRRRIGNCKHFLHARKIVSKVQRKAERVLREMNQQKDRLGELSDLSIESATSLIRSYFPLSVLILDHPAILHLTDEAKKTLKRNLTQIKDDLRDRLDDTLCDYISPELRLGPALGEDLRDWARNYPLLLFFDAYEEITEGDALLRIVMCAAGPRVGWVLAGQKNLWDGLMHSDRNPLQRYSYKEIVQPELGFSVNFNSEKVGAFSLDDIIAYFTAIRGKIPEFASNPPLSLQDAQSIFAVTQGVPLAVKLAAELYYETRDMSAVTDKVSGEETILDQMVNRYLFHASESDCQKLYSLAMLRRDDQPHAISAALALTSENAETHYRRELTYMYRHYNFFFTEKNNSSLHPHVRQSLRRWLLKRRTEPGIIACCKRLLTAQENALKALEEQGAYTSLQERVQDDEWASAYLDLIEQQFWSNPVLGLKYLLSFVLSTAVYKHNTNSEALEVGEFFSTRISEIYRNWWKWATQSLIYFTDFNVSSRELATLQGLELLIKQHSITFPSFISACTDELNGVLKEYLDKMQTENESEQAPEQHESASLQYYRRAPELDDEKKYAEAEKSLTKTVDFQLAPAIVDNSQSIEQATCEHDVSAIQQYTQAIELNPNLAAAYYNRGLANVALEQYRQAIADYNRALALNDRDANIYTDFGFACAALKQYEQAIANYTRAIQLDPTFASAYKNRGDAYVALNQSEQAVADFTHALTLEPGLITSDYNWRIDYLKMYQLTHALATRDKEFGPDDIYSAWVWIWGNMGKQRVNQNITIQLMNIAQINTECYVAYICRAIALAIENKLDEGLNELHKAISIEPEQPDAYFWKGMLCAYKGSYLKAKKAISDAMTMELVPLLLTPLYWLEKDRPDFFDRHIKSLLQW